MYYAYYFCFLLRIWIQRPMCLRGIPGIVFKLGMQFGAYLSFWQKHFFTNDEVLLSLCTHATAK